MADEAQKKGDAAKADRVHRAAESFATQLIELEKEVEDLKALVLQATQAADQAKAAVQQNARALQQKLAERQKLLSQLDQAKMQEQMNKAMASLRETVGEDVPTFDEVRDKIEARYAKAKGMAELTETTVEAACSRSSRPPRTPRRRPGWPSSAPSSASAAGHSSLPDGGRRHGGARRRSTSGSRATASASAGSTTRSSRWMTSWATSAGRSRVRRPAVRRRTRGVGGRHALGRTRRRRVRRPRPRRPRRTARHLDHAGRQQRRAPLDQRPAGAVVDDDGARRCALAKAIHSLRAGSRRSLGRERRADAGDAGDGLGQTPGRSAAAMTARTPDHEAIRAAASFDAMPPLPRAEPVPPAIDAERSGRRPATSSISEASASRRGSAVNRPGVSVSSTSRSAPTRWATSAARRSLSPKRISSSAMASFSLTTGTQPSSSRRASVWRAWRYCRRFDEVVRREQHLRGDQAVVGRGASSYVSHQPALAQRRRGPAAWAGRPGAAAGRARPRRRTPRPS